MIFGTPVETNGFGSTLAVTLTAIPGGFSRPDPDRGPGRERRYAVVI